MILETRKLTKKYGRITAVDNLNLTIPENTVFGILGPNGSGKTTTLGMILDVIEKTSGDYIWHVGEKGKERKKLGAILETPAFYPYLSGHENLRIVALIKDAPTDRIPELIAKVGLEGRENDRFKTYSLGMKQRLAIAAALISDPEVLILDEPTNGLDPAGIIEIREMIREIAGEGRTIVLASHLLHEVQQVCTDFCVLNKGKVIFTGKVDELTRSKNRYLLDATDRRKLKNALDDIDFVENVRTTGHKTEVLLKEGTSAGKLSEALATRGVYISHLSELTQSLEKKFIEILSENA